MKYIPEGWLILLMLLCSISGFVGFIVWQKSMDYACSPANLERAYLSGADKLYDQLMRSGRIKEAGE